MIVTCTNCKTRFQLNGAQTPENSFTANCPKCGQVVSPQSLTATGAAAVLQPSSAPNRSALPAAESPATRSAQIERPTPAPAYKLQPSSATAPVTEYDNAGEDKTDLAQLLTTLLGSVKRPEDNARLAWERRRALVCVTRERADRVARMLVEAHYEVFVANDAAQAISRMREDHMDVVALETEFDAAEQGAAFVTRAISTLRSADRRRVFFVKISDNARTFDTHVAFVGHVNLTINTKDIDDLAATLKRALREFNNLYREYNKTLSLTSL